MSMHDRLLALRLPPWGALTKLLCRRRTAERIAGINLLVMGTVQLLFLRTGPVVKELPSKPQAEPGAAAASAKESFVSAIRKLLLDKRVLLTFATQAFVLPLLELNSLIPLFLVQSAG